MLQYLGVLSQLKVLTAAYQKSNQTSYFDIALNVKQQKSGSFKILLSPLENCSLDYPKFDISKHILTWGVINSAGSSRYLKFGPANLVGMMWFVRVSGRSIWRPDISGLSDTNPHNWVSLDIIFHFLHTTAYWQISRWDKYEKILSNTCIKKNGWTETLNELITHMKVY